MTCPSCQAPTRVVETRAAEGGTAVRRRRHCEGCGQRFTTFERVEGRLRVRKRDGRLEPFDREKLRSALRRATHKRDVPSAAVERLVQEVSGALQEAGGELPATRIGELCLARLREVDRGAYLQFAGTLPVPNADFAAVGELVSVRASREDPESI